MSSYSGWLFQPLCDISRMLGETRSRCQIAGSITNYGEKSRLKKPQTLFYRPVWDRTRVVVLLHIDRIGCLAGHHRQVVMSSSQEVIQQWLNAGPESATLAQHWAIIVSVCAGVRWVMSPCMFVYGMRSQIYSHPGEPQGRSEGWSSLLSGCMSHLVSRTHATRL